MIKISEIANDQDSFDKIIELSKQKIDLNEVLIYLHSSMNNKSDKKKLKIISNFKILILHLEEFIRSQMDINEIVQAY